MKNKRLYLILLTATLILLMPLIAMQFTKEVDWDETDFIVGGALLFGTGLLIELVMRKVTTVKSRVILCVALLAVLFLVWAELAVGVFGTPFAGS